MTEARADVAKVFRTLSNPHIFYILETLNNSKRNSDELRIEIRSRFRLSHRSYYSLINPLASIGFIRRETHLLYSITSLGRVFLYLHQATEYALENRNIMAVLDMLEEFPRDQRNDFIESVINNPLVKDVLLNKGDISFTKGIYQIDDQLSAVSSDHHEHEIVNPRIMVVDDDNDILTTIKVILEGADYGVEIFNNSFEALKHFVMDLATPHTYDLVILDLRMPHINGFQLYQRIKAVKINTRILFLTGLDIKPELISMLPGAHLDNVIEKPVHPQQLIRKVKTLLMR
jgi:CheY-like chemotaxis protein